jgi:8-oxo-dGTP pyrophosphatase MutT (NUDIX family)
VTPSRERAETSAGGVVVHRDRTAPTARVLLIRDSYRHWGFPKGHLEDGESAEAAAIREVIEETGLVSVRVVAPLPTIAWRFQLRGTRVHKTCHFFLMETGDSTTTPQRDEGITACRWCSFDDASALVTYSDARRVLQVARGILLGSGDARTA